MIRRELLAALGAAPFFLTRPARGQAPPARLRLGVVLYSTRAADPNFAGFLTGLRELGYVEGRNLHLDVVGAEGKPERLPALVSELIGRRPDIVFALGTDMAQIVARETREIPIVAVSSSDPVQVGLAASYHRPGGNVTGFAFVAPDTAGKRLQFLKEAVPGIVHVAILWTREHPDDEFRNTKTAGESLGIAVQSVEVRGAEDFDRALNDVSNGRAQALIVASSRFVNLHQRRIAEFTTQRRIALVAGFGPWIRNGALLTYGPDLTDLARRAAGHVAKIANGAKPGDLPFEQPTKFTLALNLQTARALGLTIPPALVSLADEVIE